MKLIINNFSTASYINFIKKNIRFVVVISHHQENCSYIRRDSLNLSKFDYVEISSLKAGVKLAKLLGAKYDSGY